MVSWVPVPKARPGSSRMTVRSVSYCSQLGTMAALADGQRVVVGLPGVLPVLLLHPVRREGVLQFGLLQPPLQKVQHLGGVLVGER